MRYYCYECHRECSTMPVDDAFPFEFWGEVGIHHESFLMCEQCGSYEIEELSSEEENIIQP